jgi:poly-gamma-glutamate synthesis protein (capsule biosynthesis protein)
MRTFAAAILAAAILASCGSGLAADPVWEDARLPVVVAPGSTTVRMLFVGDVMLGRSVAPIVAADPDGLLAEVRHVISQADIALLNLESPLTHGRHESDTPHALEADPAAAPLLARAGFDVAALANNHSGDAGLRGIRDTVEALVDAGMRAIGVGVDGDTAAAPLMVETGSIRVALLAFDLTWQGPAAGAEPGLAEWETATVRNAVAAAQAAADVVVVGIHGGIEYRSAGGDPIVSPALTLLAELGVDVVWGHGPHVVQPLTTMPAGNGRELVAASSLGNFLFDQRAGETGTGAVFEVLADSDGVIAYRIGSTDHSDLRPAFLGWEPPTGNAVVIGGEWWELVRVDDWAESATVPVATAGFPHGDVFAGVEGDLTGDGNPEVIVSYRSPFVANLGNRGNEDLYADARGRAAHFGLFEPGSWRKIWAAGTVPRPIATLQACGRVLGFGYSTLDDLRVVATGAAIWRGFGFSFMPDLEGSGDLHCRDIDDDGTAELVVAR